MAIREWKHHKYIRKEGNRYIYPEDLQKGVTSSFADGVRKTGSKLNNRVNKRLDDAFNKFKKREKEERRRKIKNAIASIPKGAGQKLSEAKKQISSGRKAVSNVVNGANKKLKEAGRHVSSGKRKVNNLLNRAKSNAGQTINDVKRNAGPAIDNARRNVSRSINSTKRKVNRKRKQVWDSIRPRTSVVTSDGKTHYLN